MGKDSGIQWTTHTFNPWEGCAKVSDGCKNCYAEERNDRFYGGKHWGVGAPRLMRSESYWNEPLKWDKAARLAGASHVPGDHSKRSRVFVASLADVFEDRPDLVEPRARLFRLIEECDHLDWLLLTKRPENVLRLTHLASAFDPTDPEDWPGNIWIGTTVENQHAARDRLRNLLAIPSIYRFVSVEPQIGPVDLERVVTIAPCPFNALTGQWADDGQAVEHGAVDWVIVGGESGRRARPFEIEWAHSLVQQCKRSGAAAFVKQMGHKPRRAGELITLTGKGSDMDEWPEELRVRMFPGEAWPA